MEFRFQPAENKVLVAFVCLRPFLRYAEKAFLFMRKPCKMEVKSFAK